MGRAKLPMEPIKDLKKRNKTFHVRKESIFKKATELTKLCDVSVSMIIYNHPHETPQIFPPDLHKFNSSIDLYQMYRIADRGRIKSYDLSGFFNDRKVKIDQELEKTKKKNLETKYPSWFDFLNDASSESLQLFASRLQNKIDNVRNRVDFLKKTSLIQNIQENNSSMMVKNPTDCNNYDLFHVGSIDENQFQYQNNIMNSQYFSNPVWVNDANSMMKMLNSDQDYDHGCPMMTVNDNVSNFHDGESLNPSDCSMMKMVTSDNCEQGCPMMTMYDNVSNFHGDELLNSSNWPMTELLMSNDYDKVTFETDLLPEFCSGSDEILEQQLNELLMSEFGSS